MVSWAWVTLGIAWHEYLQNLLKPISKFETNYVQATQINFDICICSSNFNLQTLANYIKPQTKCIIDTVSWLWVRGWGETSVAREGGWGVWVRRRTRRTKGAPWTATVALRYSPTRLDILHVLIFLLEICLVDIKCIYKFHTNVDWWTLALMPRDPFDWGL